MNWQRDHYLLSDDKSRLDLDAVYALLHATYWAKHRSREIIAKSIQHSVCFGLFWEDKQVGFTRAVTDYATFAWICDVVIAPEHRGRGLGKWIIECVLAHPELQTVTHVLRTRDAHSLYERFGFKRTEYLRRSQSDWSKTSAPQ
jgi:GNAT superfamily N-acetyltransferase